MRILAFTVERSKVTSLVSKVSLYTGNYCRAANHR
jgi:hypothetical protein